MLQIVTKSIYSNCFGGSDMFWHVTALIQSRFFGATNQADFCECESFQEKSFMVKINHPIEEHILLNVNTGSKFPPHKSSLMR